MDISALSSGASGSSGSALSGQMAPLASKKAADSLGLNKAINQGAIVSGLLPALASGSSGSSRPAGLSSDIYTAVGMQTQGMMSRGLMGIQIANISLGIDMSQAAKDAAPEKQAEDDATAAPTRYYSSPELSNPALGGLLNSLG